MTLVDLLSERARDPAYTPYIFLEDGEDDTRSITAAELDLRARRIAAALDAKPGDRALIVIPPGLDYIAAFFGCLYAGVIAVPAYPPDPRRLARTMPRLEAIIHAAGANAVLTLRAFAGLAHGDMRCIAVDDLGTAIADPVSHEIAMLQFTSGSTASPRGVILPHATIRANLDVMTRAFELDKHPPPRVVSWLPPYHDMGLVGAILIALHTGGTTILMSPLHFLQRPVRWLRAITKYRADISGGPNFAYDLCARKIDPAKESLDLSHWQVAFNGAEVVRAQTMDRFAERFASVGFQRRAFFPCYGLAEVSLIATGAQREQEPRTIEVDGVQRVSSGRPPQGIELLVVDGEVWLRGASVGAGYWGRPDETAATFGAITADGRGPFLRTGDLGFVDDGELYVTGRIKDLIILNGRKLFPDDIERVASVAHPALRPGGTAAFAVDVGDKEQLVIAQEIEAGADEAEVRAAIMRAVFESFDVTPHEIVLLAAGELPKTSSGKVQRHLARKMRGE